MTNAPTAKYDDPCDDITTNISEWIKRLKLNKKQCFGGVILYSDRLGLVLKIFQFICRAANNQASSSCLNFLVRDSLIDGGGGAESIY